MRAIFIIIFHLLAASISRASPFTVPTPTSTQAALATVLASSTCTIVPLSSPVKTLCRGNGRNSTLLATGTLPTVTPAPMGGIFHEPGSTGAAVAKFRQTTYYTCVTWPSTVHCGWHEPIVDASMNGVRSHHDRRRGAMAAGSVLVVLAGLYI
ncbi:hypothetical protein BJ166DRAFT_536180 [Pestalotiopsis sp. NC0098]|nr:hypothetical protein BJ166DRAFT_536180 [Pestalotiopsis sp. NC0098]